MEEKRLSAESLSGRQLSVAVMVAGLSPAAALAGSMDWPWMVVWTGVGAVVSWLVLWRVGNRPIYQGAGGVVLYVVSVVWATVLAARVLSRSAARLELSSGGSPRFWLLLILMVPLIWISWGKAAPFFRMVEILWLAMVVILAFVLVFGVARVEWRYVLRDQGNWAGSALGAGEIFAPALFLLPYIYKVEERSDRKGVAWLTALGAVSAALSLITVGILGAAAEQVPYAFYAAAGLLGKSARCEGLLSVLWLLPDLTLAGLLCRVWGAQKWPALGAGLAFLLAVTGIVDWISQAFCVFGSMILAFFLLFLPRGKGKIVVKF